MSTGRSQSGKILLFQMTKSTSICLIQVVIGVNNNNVVIIIIIDNDDHNNNNFYQKL